VVESPAPRADEVMALADDLSVALLVTLERLSPLERAAFLLHDVFEMEFGDVADVLERSEAAVRQLAARARDHVRDERPRFTASSDATSRLADAFHSAVVQGDLAAIAQLLAEDAVFYSDGGGKRRAALNPIYGRAKILRFFAGVARRRGPSELRRATINGLPGFVIHGAEGVETLALEISGEHIVAVYAIRNPDKLRHVE
jgi:RNA polymerase sigma-70 factor (ECF subfamily)